MKVAKPNITVQDLLPFIGKAVAIIEFNPDVAEPTGSVGTLLYAVYADDAPGELTIIMQGYRDELDSDRITFNRTHVIHVMDQAGLGE